MLAGQRTTRERGISMMNVTVEIKNSVEVMKQLKEYKKMAEEINAMSVEAQEKCIAAIDAGQYDAALAYMKFIEECTDAIDEMRKHVLVAY